MQFAFVLTLYHLSNLTRGMYTGQFSTTIMIGKRIYIIIFAFLIFFSAYHSISAAEGNLYTIHCASYKTKDKAADDVKKFGALGYSAFAVAVDINGKGKWYRVFAGKFDSMEKAKLTAEEMKAKKLISEYSIFPFFTEQSKKNKEIKVEDQVSPEDKSPKIKQEKPQKINKEKKETIGAKKKETDKLQHDPLSIIIDKNNNKIKNAVEIGDEKEEVNSGSELFDKAIGEYKEKNYDRALVIFKEFVTRDDTSKELGERALRKMADCYYFLGTKGKKESLRIAVEFYKNTLQSFPDPRKENALTYFHMAKSYEYLKNYTDSLKIYENLLAQYPESPYAQESAFKIGEMLYLTGKYNQAADKLIAYLMKYRGGQFAKNAFYLVADCYYKLKQSASAEIWFRDAQKKWPDIMDIQKEIIIDMGQHKYSVRRYDDAISIFSIYVNLYPNEEKSKEVLLMLANSYKAAAEYSAALTIYNMIIERYPTEKEAKESIMAMASLGVEKPGVKVFSALSNIHYYKNPIDAYDTVLMKTATGDVAEIAMLQKGEALHKMKKDRSSADIYLEFLKMYPQSKMIDEAKKGLKLASGTLLDEYFQKKDYLAVADIYYKAYGALPFQADEYDRINKIIISMREIGLNEESLRLLKDYKKICKDETVGNKIMLEIAEGEMDRAKYDEAESILNELIVKPAFKNTAMMTMIKKHLAEIAYKKRLYDKAVTEYESVINSGHNINNTGHDFLYYADSLKEKKDNSRALQNYLTAVKYFGQDKKTAESYGETYKEIGDLYFQTRNYKSGLDMYNKAVMNTSDQDLKNWSRIYAGQSYLMMTNNAEAQKTFLQIKTESGPEGFWTKVVDYYVDDQKWWEKYGGQLKK
jgi:TolA-binding protein